MASASYSFLDIVVLDTVRERFAAGDALAVLSPDLKEVLWANGAGAEWLGYRDIEAAIGERPRLPAVALRQIAAAPGFPHIGRDRPMALRIAGGLTSRIVDIRASTITLPGGEEALLLALPFPGADGAQTGESAGRIVAGFDEPGHFAALVEADGRVAAASKGFGALGITAETLELLVREVQGEEDRLVKKRVAAGDRQLPAGIARLTDEPARHLLVVVDEATPARGDEAAPEKVEPTTQAEAAEDVVAEIPPAPRAPIQDEAPEAIADRDLKADGKPPRTEEDGKTAHTEERPSPRTVRFSWRTDAQGRFSALSEEFAEAMGKPAADILGRSFREVSNAFGLDPEGSITRLLERRDTWSGRTVMWPLSGTDLKVPVDLAALPVYGRGRIFEGFRGFGIARLGEAVVDPEAIGTVLVAPPSEEPAAPAPEEASADIAQVEEEPELRPEADPFLGEKPAIAISGPGKEEPADKIIRLAEHRETERNGGLSTSERTAFREIGERLRRADKAQPADTQTEARDVPAASALPVEPEEQEAEETLPAKEPHSAADEDEAAQRQEIQALESMEPDTAQAVPQETEEAEEIAENQEDAVPKPSAEKEEAEPEQPAETPGETERATEPPTAPEAMPQEPPAAETDPRPDVMPSAFFQPAEKHGGAETEVSLIARLPLPVLIHAGDRLHHANREFLKLTGYESLAALEAAGGIGALFEEPSAPGGTPREKLRLRRADGLEMLVEAHLQSVTWEGGKALMLALHPSPEAAAEPVSETAELEERLVEMRAIVDTATDGIVVIANDGTIRSINRPAEALFGFDAEHVTGKPFSSLFAIESQRTVEEYLAALSDNGVASVLNDGRQVIGREAQGRFIPLFMTIGRLPGGNGHCAVLRDITHWKRAEEELTQARAQAERASSQKSEFLARVSHEVRTPLNAIIGFSELMMDEKFGPIGNGRYRDYLRDINRSGNHVLELVNDLLDISKIEAGQQEMANEAVSLNETLGQVVAMMQPQANSERVIIRSSFASRLPDVVADLRSVRQIAINLLSNAVRYTPAGGQVIVSTAYEKDGAVALRVRDTGVGMSAAELDEAMKPFKQINTLRRKRGDGTGLGLPLTRAMVEANRAQFSIVSTPGEGTLVEITFPPTRVLAD